jgi:hypothetical protein
VKSRRLLWNGYSAKMGGEMECIHNFDAETSWKMTISKTAEEVGG